MTCLERQVWLLGLVAGSGARRATLREEDCLAEGGEVCRYVLTWVEGPAPGPVALAGIAVAAWLGVASVLALLPADAWLLVPLAAAVAWMVVARRAGVRSSAAERAAAVALSWFADRLRAHAVPDHAEPGERSPSATAVPAWAPPTFEQDGEVWRLTYGGKTVSVRHSRGLALLAHLVRQPGSEINVRVLDAITPAGGSAVAREAPAPPGGIMPAGDDDADVLDARARDEYRRRIRDVQEELEEAESNHDVGRAELLRTELASVAEELRKATGLGGRPRRMSSDMERRRVAITRRIRAAISQVQKHHLALGDHLAATVSTGIACGYHPARLAGIDASGARRCAPLGRSAPSPSA